MKETAMTLVVTPYIEDESVNFNISRKMIENKKSVFGDFFIDTKKLPIDKCIFLMNRFDKADRDNESIRRTLSACDGIIRIRMGESFVISNLSDTKHLQILSIEDQKVPNGRLKLLYLDTKKADRDTLETARKFAQRQDQIKRNQNQPNTQRPEQGVHKPVMKIRDTRYIAQEKKTWYDKLFNCLPFKKKPKSIRTVRMVD